MLDVSRIDFRDVSETELREFVERVRPLLRPEDVELLERLVDTLSLLGQLLEDKSLSIRRLRKLLFGPSTEKTDRVLGEPPEQEAKPGAVDEKEAEDGGEANGAEKKAPARGHGRNGADRYTGAERVAVSHPELSSGAGCPECTGKVYAVRPKSAMRITGSPLLSARLYEMERWRCNLCGKTFAAPLPAEAGDRKYDESAGSLVALLKYGAGLPFHRLERLQGSLGVPLPASTQWEIVEDVARRLRPAFDALIEQAAQGDVLHIDDTDMTILEFAGRDKGPEDGKRKGVFTSGIVAQMAERSIALYFTGPRHAGERLTELLAQRATELGPPIQMCDGLSRNLPKNFETLLANCLAHGRRQFVEIAPNFPDACRFVLESLRDVYRNDETARERDLSPQERLAYHRAESGPILDRLRAWMEQQFEEKRVEPNSGLGKAMTYLLKRWEPLTLFLRVAGAPLDNNVCERSLKQAILHRKNALFYRTQNGAWVGDLFMSLIHTCRLSGANPFDYLTELQKHADLVAAKPHEWLPWNYPTATDRSQPPPARVTATPPPQPPGHAPPDKPG